MSEKTTIIGFALIVLAMLGGVVYNWGYGGGVDQAASAVTRVLDENQKADEAARRVQKQQAEHDSLLLSIDSISSVRGALGTLVTLTGRNFSTSTYLLLNGKKEKLFGGNIKASLNSTTIVFTLPKLSSSEPVTLQLVNEIGTSSEVTLVQE